MSGHLLFCETSLFADESVDERKVDIGEVWNLNAEDKRTYMVSQIAPKTDRGSMFPNGNFASTLATTKPSHLNASALA